MLANRLRIYPHNNISFKKANYVLLTNETNSIFKNSTGNVYSDTVNKAVAKRDFIYFLSTTTLSIYERETNRRLYILRNPEPHLIFKDVYVSDTSIYVGTNSGVYSIPIASLDSDIDSSFILKFSFEDLGGKNVGGIYGRSLFEKDYLAVSHENGLTIITNDGELYSKLVVSNTNPGSVFITTEGNTYYQNKTNGMYYIENLPTSENIELIMPFQDWLYSDLPSNDFVGLSVSENNISSYRNTVFCGTSEGISIITENLSSMYLSSVLNISIPGIIDFVVSRNASYNSGYIYYITSDGDTNTLSKYDLSSSSVVETFSSDTEPSFPDGSFVMLREI